MKQKYNRIIPVIAAIAIQLCLGTAYIWSVFQNGIASSIFGGSNADAALTFSLLLALLGIGGTIGGTLQNKIGPRITVIIGGLILSIGFFVASFTDTTIIWTLSGITIAFMTLPNLIGILLLHRDMKQTLKKYWDDFYEEYEI